jgi:hypothetical protein
MNIVDATASYEAWLAGQTPLVKDDLALKHQRMREELFPFLRATYYRWAQVWPGICPECAGDPVALAVGDLHVENFGTWRDAEARLVWGVNDLDECHPLPFSHDLTRLAVSADFAIAAGELALSRKDASAAILDGYRACLDAGGRPLILSDADTPLREMARHRLETPEKFWTKIGGYPAEKGPVPAEVTRFIRELLPDPAVPLRFLHRVAGLGSLGKQRYLGVGTWCGGQIAREAKALSVSACVWVEGGKGADINYDRLLKTAVRCPDPLVRVCGTWLVRRLSPDCFRIELSGLPVVRDETKLLHAMGWETANLHLGTLPAAKLSAALKQKPANWLHQAAKAMGDQTVSDWKEWQSKGK